MAVLQGVAWAGMLSERLISYQSLDQAFSETFNGEHPCALCSAVQDLQEHTPTPGDLTEKVVKKAEKTVIPLFMWPVSSVTERCSFMMYRTRLIPFAADVEVPPPRV
jgi:hypothetical protein